MAVWHCRSRLILTVFLALALVLVLISLAARLHEHKTRCRALSAAATLRRQQAEAYRITLRSIGDAVIAIDREGRIRIMNAAAEALTGWRESDAVGHTVRDVFHVVNEHTREEAGDLVARVLREGETVGLANDSVLIAKDGKERPIADSAAPILDEAGQITGVVLVFRDQTTEQNYRSLFLRMNDGLSAHELICNDGGVPVDYRFLNVNPAFEQLTGFKARDIVGRTVRSVLPAMASLTETFGQVVKTGVPVEFEQHTQFIGKTLRVSAFRSAANQFATIVQDITERRRIENALRESEGRYRSMTDDVLDHTDVGIFILDAEFKVVWINRAIERFFGFERRHTLGLRMKDLIREQISAAVEDPDGFVQRVFAMYDDNTFTDRFECHVLPKGDRAERWLLQSSRPIREGIYAGGRIEHYYDITDRKKAEESHRQLAIAIEQSGDIVIVTDTHGVIRYVNHAFERITGYTRAEVIGRNPRILKSGRHGDEFYRTMWATLARGESFVARMVNRRKDGSYFTQDSTISPIFDPRGQVVSYVAVARDVTRQLAIEADMQQTQRIESIGRLAGGVAHDFNNMLSVILGHAELALADMQPDSQLAAELQAIIQAVNQSRDIIQQLLAFACKQIIAPKVLDLNAAIENMLKMLRRLIGENIDLVWRPCAHPCKIEIDPSQLNQVLANLCLNARDAITDVGRIILATNHRTLDREYCKGHQGSKAGQYVTLTISDTGRGIDAKTRSHLFEPFFTTKEKGKGTGLGLATVHGIVQQNNGFITVYSELGQGATFSIYLPYRADAQIDSPENPGDESPPGRGERILLVEDEPAILNMGKTILERLGYRVMCAPGPEAAIKAAADPETTIDLLVTDVVMPGMNGCDLARQLRDRQPGLKCLFMSGYTADAIARHGVMDKGLNFIQKPFSREEIAKAVRQALDRPAGGP